MRKSNQYLFVGKDEECDWIDENIKNWTQWVRDHLYMDMKQAYRLKVDRLGFRITLILLGMVILTFSYLTTNIIPFIVFFTVGLYLVSFGFIALMWEVKYNAR